MDGTAFQSSNVFPSLGAGAYSLTMKDVNGCTAVKNVVIADGKVIPAPNVSSDISACLGSPIPLTNIIYESGNKLLWYNSNGISILAPTANTLGKQTYSISQLSPEGCESGKTSISISVLDCTPGIFDLALRKTVADTNKTYKPNELVTFNVTVYNQGNTKAYNIDVIDYIPTGMSFAGNISQWKQSDANAVSRIDSLAAKDSITLKIALRVNIDFQNGNLLNKAEIFGADLDKLGKNHITSDIDSRFDKNPNNDIGGKEKSPTDDDILGDGDGRFDVIGGIDPKHDEDDADPALFRVVLPKDNCFDLARRRRVMPNLKIWFCNKNVLRKKGNSANE